MKYVVIPRKNPQNWSAAPLYYLTTRSLGVVKLEQITNEIALATSLTRGDVANTIQSLLDCIPKYMKMGYSVKLGEFGTYRLTLNSFGSEDPEDAKPTKVKRIGIGFYPSTQLRKDIQDTPLEEFPE
ncbi:hypothetical protein LJB98_05070 [Bacteroidales bacterium OttesenSCG-928-M11]|nr:hypothetical protein [Bacteroidales bacterium OttesenSCG-928-M11]